MRLITVAAAAAIALSCGLGAFAEDSIPTRFTFPVDEAPIWIAASAAITPEGTMRPDVLRARHREALRRRGLQLKERRARDAAEGRQTDPVRRAVADACDVEFFGMSEFSMGWPVRSVAELQEAAASRSIITGVVTETAAGVHAGMPHTVLRIETAPPARDRVVHLLYPSGQLRFEGMTVCNHDPGFAPLPAAGDAIAFVVAAPPIDSTGTLYTTDGSWILYEHAGVVVAGLALQKDATLKTHGSLQALTNILRNDASGPVE